MSTRVRREVSGRPGSHFHRGNDTTSAVAMMTRADLRAEFGTHLEENYPRLVSQLAMITLDAGEAHKLIEDAYARAWQRWSAVRELSDPTAWIRQSAVRASARRWRWLKLWRKRSSSDAVLKHPGNQSVIKGLGRLNPYIRRPLVLADVAHLPIEEVARVEGIVKVLAESRVARGRDELAKALRAQPDTEPGAATAWERM